MKEWSSLVWFLRDLYMSLMHFSVTYTAVFTPIITLQASKVIPLTFTRAKLKMR